MELLKHISDKDFGLATSDKGRKSYRAKEAARAIIINSNNDIAILYVAKDKLYKLPGGGIEEGESIKDALKREMLEETGCSIKVVSEVGLINEYYDSLKITQTSHCFLCESKGKAIKQSFTASENDLGFKLQWMNIDQAIKKLTACKPNFYRGKFIRLRDLLFLKKAKLLMHQDLFTKIVIIKHGQTIQNAKKICTGQLDGELSEKGVHEAEVLAKKFSKYKIDAVYSSDLRRAVNTANVIIKYHGGLVLKTDKRLRERFFGKLQGKPFPKNLDWKNLPADIETEEAMYERSKKFISHIRNKYPGKTVLIVCHDGIRASLISAALNKYVSWEEVSKKRIFELEVKKYV